MKTAWYAQTTPEVFTTLATGEAGLSKTEAEKRLREQGLNKLPEGKTDHWFVIFFRQFQSPLIYLLLAAAAITFLMGELVDGFVILAVLIFNAIVGSVQEGKAQNTLLALKQFAETTALVLRDGKERIIPDTEIVPGDIIVLQEGEKIPADARLIFSHTLQVNEASLTGESVPVIKTDAALATADLAIVEQKNMVFRGTLVASGSGTAVVVATGLATEIGKIAQKITAIDTEIPLKKNIRYLSRLIVTVVLIVSAVLVVVGMLSGQPLVEMFSIAVALAVSIIPEGLPIVMTLVLATGVWRMSKHRVLVKRLQAVEALGQTQIIAVDKTGTLTKNEMVVQRVYVGGTLFEITGNGYEPKGETVLDSTIVNPLNHPDLLFIGRAAVFCVNARVSFIEDTSTWKVVGDPTEAAMLVFAEKIGFKHDALEREMPRLFELPFDYRRKYHASVHTVEGKNMLAVAGAPEAVLGLCKNMWREGAAHQLRKESREELEHAFQRLARDGYRVVAIAANTDTNQTVDADKLPSLTFVGFLGMKDALRAEVHDAIERVKAAAMRVVMITGDHRLTAEAVAKEAGIFQPGDAILTGEDIDALSVDELAKRLSNVSVFARVTPEHKLHIIQAYRTLGKVVAMTGDGVNDAPPLVAADLGVGMGKIGTEVAKEASDIVLLDDNFSAIVSAAEEGRSIYKTIKKVMLYLFSTSVGELFAITGALALGLALPILPIQIIWLNFVTDGFLDVSLAMEPKEKGLLRGTFRRPKKWIVDRLMLWRMLVMAVPMAVGTLILFKDYAAVDSAKAWTISLTTLAMFQWLNAWNCRSEERSIFQINPFSNKFLLGATALVIGLQFAALYMPFFQKILHTVPLMLNEWLTIIPVTVSIVVAEEVRKAFSRWYRQRIKTAVA